MPILAGHFWHNNLHKGLVSAGLSVPVLAYLIIHQLTTGVASFGPLLHAVEEYIDFIVPLAALYIIAGGIVVEGDIRPTPLANIVLLAIGAVLANLIGTTGASMLLIRPDAAHQSRQREQRRTFRSSSSSWSATRAAC